ncbi:MAG TPA: apolipoprotein N-acyltransferase, partial [Acidimicrobiales bacterium]|nr:apolipoprotein N-acyltransferase [Acidimicrobiales bacterium]
FGGVPLGGVFLGQAGGPLLATARLGGPLLLTAEVWVVGGSLGELALMLPRLRLRRPAVHLRADAAPAKPAVAAAMVGIAGVVLLGGLGVVAPSGSPTGGWVRVTAVQGGGRRGTTAQQVDPATVLRAQVRSSAALTPQRGPDPSLVVWPEDVISLSRPLPGSPQAATLAALARRLRATVLAGVTVDTGPSSFRNEVVGWGPDGRVVGVYEKVHRVPFGEYIPWRGLVRHLADVSAVPEDAVPGRGSGLVHTTAAPLGAMVSYEVFFADRGRSGTRAGAQLLVVPTNTSSYSSAQVPTQEVAASRLQAVAEGRDLVQAAPTGFSAVVDHDGRVLARSSLGPGAVLVRTVGLRTGRTLYERLGDLPVLVLAGAALVAGAFVVPSLPRRRARAIR